MLTFLIISLSRLEAKKITPEVTKAAEWAYAQTEYAHTYTQTVPQAHTPPTSCTSTLGPQICLSLHECLHLTLFLSFPQILLYLVVALTLSVWSICEVQPLGSPLFTYVRSDVKTLRPSHPCCPHIWRQSQQCVACSHWCLSLSCLLNAAYVLCLILNPMLRG